MLGNRALVVVSIRGVEFRIDPLLDRSFREGRSDLRWSGSAGTFGKEVPEDHAYPPFSFRRRPPMHQTARNGIGTISRRTCARAGGGADDPNWNPNQPAANQGGALAPR